MNHTDHVNLLRLGGMRTGEVWADLGAGSGAFTLALAELLGASGTIYAVDRDGAALRQQATTMHAQYPQIAVHYLTADFTKPLTLPPLDGIVMANALHFVNYGQQLAVLRQLAQYLRPGRRLLIVEYNTDRGNTYVPYPFAYETWVTMAARAGFTETEQIGLRPSRFLGSIYSAVSLWKGET
jgi:ubiquinone/menaquinone biosynthesis C-methylase UbiE